MGWKRLIKGDKMPDKNDPQYKERYEREVNTGRKFAKLLKIDKVAVALQRSAERAPKLFLGVVFGVVISCFALNVYRLVRVSTDARAYQTAVEQQEKRYQQKRQLSKTLDSITPTESTPNIDTRAKSSDVTDSHNISITVQSKDKAQ